MSDEGNCHYLYRFSPVRLVWAWHATIYYCVGPPSLLTFYIFRSPPPYPFKQNSPYYYFNYPSIFVHFQIPAMFWFGLNYIRAFTNENSNLNNCLDPYKNWMFLYCIIMEDLPSVWEWLFKCCFRLFNFLPIICIFLKHSRTNSKIFRLGCTILTGIWWLLLVLRCWPAIKH